MASCCRRRPNSQRIFGPPYLCVRATLRRKRKNTTANSATRPSFSDWFCRLVKDVLDVVWRYFARCNLRDAIAGNSQCSPETTPRKAYLRVCTRLATVRVELGIMGRIAEIVEQNAGGLHNGAITARACLGSTRPIAQCVLANSENIMNLP